MVDRAGLKPCDQPLVREFAEHRVGLTPTTDWARSDRQKPVLMRWKRIVSFELFSDVPHGFERDPASLAHVIY